MAEHIKYECSQPCDKPYCAICEGGLFLCNVCHGAEGSLPTECPGVEMTEDEQARVYAGVIDYKNGNWIIIN